MFRPRIKLAHQPIRRGETEIEIGGGVPGIANRIMNPPWWLWPLLESMDGTRTTAQLAARIAYLFPGLPEDIVLDAIDDFVEEGHVEDPDAPDLLPDELRERHRAGIALFHLMDRKGTRSGADSQLRLAQARVTVIGLGGVGGSAAFALAGAGVGHLHCVDRDRVEPSNLPRQVLYTDKDIDEFKAQAALRPLRARNPGTVVTGEVLSIEEPAQLRRFAAECDVLLMAADEPAEIRSWTNDACLDTGTPWVHSGYAGPLANIGVYRPWKGPCYACGQLDRRDKEASRPTPVHWTPGIGRTQANAANAISVSIAGDYAAWFVTSLLAGVPCLLVNCEYGFNLMQPLEPYSIRLSESRVDCPACGS